MGRSTQYVGLTHAAMVYVERAVRVESYVMTHGMFDEEIHGYIYHLAPPDGPNKACYLKEEVQTEPWSSGPMIFTHLREYLVKECGQVLDMGDPYFSWVIDPGLKDRHTEFDQELGTYYV